MGAPDEIIVVENDACGESAMWATEFVQTITLCPGRNLGFPGGVNAGIREALSRGASRVLLVNSDVTLEPGCIASMLDALERHPQAGVAGPLVLERHAPDRVQSMGISYDCRSGRMRLRGSGRAADAVPRGSVETVDAVAGCVMLIDCRVFDAIGLFDEAYFFGFEDLDFCLRARRAGYTTVAVPAARALHEGSRTIGAASSLRLYYAARNHLRLGRRHASSGGRIAARSREAAIVGLNAAHALRAPVGRIPERLAAVGRGVADYALGRFGQA